MKNFLFVISIIIISTTIYLYLKNCPTTKKDEISLYLYRIKFLEGFRRNWIVSEFIMINGSDSCIDGIRDKNRFNFFSDSLNIEKIKVEFISKDEGSVNSEIAPNDTVFYYVVYEVNQFDFKNLKNNIYHNPSKIKFRNDKNAIRFVTHSNIKIVLDSVNVLDEKYMLQYDKIEYNLKQKSPFERKKYMYDNFYLNN